MELASTTLTGARRISKNRKLEVQQSSTKENNLQNSQNKRLFFASAISSWARLIVNQPYDESVSIYDDEEVASTFTPSPRAAVGSNKKSEPMTEPSDEEFDHDDNEFDDKQPKRQPNEAGHQPMIQRQQPVDHQQQSSTKGVSGPRPPGGHVIEASDEEDDDEDDQSESSGDEDGKAGANTEGTYDPADYEHLPVSQEIKELFQYITRYTPQAIDLDYKLRPFIPDYIPAVGDIDAFLKVSRPDGKGETLGLQILDEPCAKQSDPTVLDLQLRSISKQTSAKQMVVRSVADPDKKPKEIDSWINSITELHRQKPPQNVHYNKPMPDIETLMQEWPPEFEELLKTSNLPSADLDCDLTEYIDLLCSLLDIPIYKNRIQSLHVLFTLYAEFKNSQHFNQLARDNLLSNDLKLAEPLETKSLDQESESISFS